MRNVTNCAIRLSLAGSAGIALLLNLAVIVCAESPVTLDIGKFSAAKAGGAFPDSWKPLTFEKIAKHTNTHWWTTTGPWPSRR